MTNLEKIGKMTADELAKWLTERFDGSVNDCILCPAMELCDEVRHKSCREIIKQWLAQEVK